MTSSFFLKNNRYKKLLTLYIICFFKLFLKHANLLRSYICFLQENVIIHSAFLRIYSYSFTISCLTK